MFRALIRGYLSFIFPYLKRDSWRHVNSDSWKPGLANGKAEFDTATEH